MDSQIPRSPAGPSGAATPVRLGRPSLAEARQRRETLLAVAFDEFSQHGFAGTRIDEIARKAGVGRVSIYRNYDDKAGLFRAAARERTGQLADRLHHFLNAGPPSRERLRELVSIIYQAFTAPGLLGTTRLVVAEAERFPDVCNDLWETEMGAVSAPIVQFIRQAQQHGAMRLGPPEAAAFHLLNLACGGFRFLINPPLASAVEQQTWIDSVVAFVWPEPPPGAGR